jgi:putative DNA primase/helicase
MLDAALAFAARGWPVFPCSPENKRPLLPKDKDSEGRPIRGSGGVSKASTAPEQIRSWWKRWPHAMIGVSVGKAKADTGSTAGLFVLDFDPRTDPETGEDFTLDRLKPETEAKIGCALPPSLGVRTPSGGVHVYYRQPEGEPITNRGNLPRHVDVRGLGGYTIVPPSFCEGDGKNARGGYRWLHGDADAPIAEAPPELIAVLRDKATRTERERLESPPGAPGRAPAPEIVDERLRSFALKALDEECRELAATPIGGGRHGGRNNGIYHAAFNLGQLIGAGALQEAVARAAIEAVVRAMPHNHDLPGALQTIDNGLERGKAVPRDLSHVGRMPTARSGRVGSTPRPPPPEADSRFFADPPVPAGDDIDPERSSQMGGSRGGVPAGGAGDDPHRDCAFFQMTDLGNVERFLRRRGHDFLYVAEWGWLAWDGQRWNRERAQSLVMQAVHETVRAIADEADAIAATGLKPDHPKTPMTWQDREKENGQDFVVEISNSKGVVLWSDKIRAWSKTSESAGHLGCVASHAAPYLTAKPEDFDADPFAINLKNGTLQLVPPNGPRAARALLRRHDRRDLITKMAGVAYDPEAACPIYDGFLERVQPSDGMRRFLHAWGGYNLTGDTSAQKLVFFYGLGANGKSTWVDQVAFVLGDYATTVGIETFMDQGRGRKGGDATPDLASLAGRRMVRTSEPEKGSKWADALIKLVTGGEPIKVRELNMPFFEMIVGWKLTISGNHRPAIGTDHGIWRRMRLVPWMVTIPEDERDDSLAMKLRLEAAGILNRLIAGALDWMTGGLPEPEEVLQATADYKEASDPLGRFLELCVRAAPGQRVQSSQLFRLYEAWARWAGEPEWKQKGFTGAMLDRGYRKMQSNTVQWLDVAIVRSVDDFIDHEGNPREADLPADPTARASSTSYDGSAIDDDLP